MKHNILTLILAAIGVTSLSAQILVEHNGAADPSTEGFTLDSSGTFELEPVHDEFGLDAWSINTFPSPGIVTYSHQLLPEEWELASMNGWELSARFRFLEEGWGLLAFRTQPQDFDLQIRMTENEDIAIFDAWGSWIYTLEDAGAEYYEYSLSYDPAMGSASLSIAGIGMVGEVEGRLGFGGESVIFGTGQAGANLHWNELRFSAVPEPATVGLLTGLSALFMTILFHWRRRGRNRMR